MKIIITESQFVDLFFFKRRFGRVNDLIEKVMYQYDPCDYMSNEYYGFRDYYDDVRDRVVYQIIAEDPGLLSLRNQDDTGKLDYFIRDMKQIMYDIYYDKARVFYDQETYKCM
jgi:hypothetical protein